MCNKLTVSIYKIALAYHVKVCVCLDRLVQTMEPEGVERHADVERYALGAVLHRAHQLTLIRVLPLQMLDQHMFP